MHNSPRILIVDDEPGIVQSLSIRLRSNGFDVISADNGDSGIALAKSESPDLILLDLRMPGMDGFDVLRMLKEFDATHDTPVITLSANVVEKSRVEALALGSRCFIEKPFDGSKVISKIKSLLALSPGSSSA